MPFYREDESKLVAMDNSELPPVVNCSADSGSQFDIGETKVICQALDLNGNQATCSFNVNVGGTCPILYNEIMTYSLGFERHEYKILSTTTITTTTTTMMTTTI